MSEDKAEESLENKEIEVSEETGAKTASEEEKAEEKPEEKKPEDLKGETEKQPSSAREEKTLCSSSPSQVLNLKSFFISVVFIAVVITIYILLENKYSFILIITAIPFFSSLWKYLQVKCLKYELTNERIRIISGVLNKKTEEIELYRVKDSSIEEPFFYRLLGV